MSGRERYWMRRAFFRIRHHGRGARRWLVLYTAPPRRSDSLAKIGWDR